MTPHESKELFEFLAQEGECWHEIPVNPQTEREMHTCIKCGLEDVKFDWAEDEDIRIPRNIDFSTWSGFGWLWERVLEKDWWEHFERWASRKWGVDHFHFFPTLYIHPERFSIILLKYKNEMARHAALQSRLEDAERKLHPKVQDVDEFYRD